MKDIPFHGALLQFCIASILLSGSLFGQAQNTEDADSTFNTIHVFQLPSLFYSLTPSDLHLSRHSRVPGLLFFELATPSEYDAWSREESIDLDAPWKLHLKDQEDNAGWRRILGTVQVGGAAYILYRHIKKYGLK